MGLDAYDYYAVLVSHTTSVGKVSAKILVESFPVYAFPVCVATLICFFLGQYLENGRSYAQSHKITLNQHDPSNLYTPEVTSDVTFGLCGNPKKSVLGQ